MYVTQNGLTVILYRTLRALDISSVKEHGMSIVEFGNVAERQDKPTFKSRECFIALVDILGMGVWTHNEKSDVIAFQVNAAIQDAIGQASCGSIDRNPIGPLIGTAMFSDSILLYSPDSSWSSFAILCSTVCTLVGLSLSKGVPLRGAITQGSVVVETKKSLYIGSPLRDAYCADAKMNHRGVGVKITEKTIGYLSRLYETTAIPDGFNEGIEEYLSGTKTNTNLLIKFNDEDFVNHWYGAFFHKSGDFEVDKEHLNKCFYKRNLPRNEKVDSMYKQTLEFMRQALFIPKTIEEMILDSRNIQKRISARDCYEAYKEELLRLNKLVNFE